MITKKTKIKAAKENRLNKTSTYALYSMCSIPMLLVFIFSYIPMFGIVIAFKDYRFDEGILGSKWVGLKNFEFFFKSDDFYRITRNTLFLNFLFIVVGTLAALAVAILLYELRGRISVKFYQTSIILPHFVSWVIVGYIAYSILSPQYGFLNQFLKYMGMKPIDVYSMPYLWYFLLPLFNVWKGVGMGSVVYYAALMGIDKEYFEASVIDGANKWQQIKFIIIPCLKSLIIIQTILSIGGIFRNDWGMFYQLTRNVGTLYETTDVLDTYIYRVMKVAGDFTMSSAAGFLQSIVGFVLILTTNYVVNKIDPDDALF